MFELASIRLFNINVKKNFPKKSKEEIKMEILKTIIVIIGIIATVIYTINLLKFFITKKAREEGSRFLFLRMAKSALIASVCLFALAILRDNVKYNIVLGTVTMVCCLIYFFCAPKKITNYDIECVILKDIP